MKNNFLILLIFNPKILRFIKEVKVGIIIADIQTELINTTYFLIPPICYLFDLWL